MQLLKGANISKITGVGRKLRRSGGDSSIPTVAKAVRMGRALPSSFPQSSKRSILKIDFLIFVENAKSYFAIFILLVISGNIIFPEQCKLIEKHRSDCLKTVLDEITEEVSGRLLKLEID